MKNSFAMGGNFFEKAGFFNSETTLILLYISLALVSRSSVFRFSRLSRFGHTIFFTCRFQYCWNFLALTAVMLCCVCHGTKTMRANFSDHWEKIVWIWCTTFVPTPHAVQTWSNHIKRMIPFSRLPKRDTSFRFLPLKSIFS